MDLRQSREYARYMQRRGWLVEKISLAGNKREKVTVVVKRLPLTPVSVMKCQRFVGELDVGDIKKIKRKHRVIYSVWEPEDEKGLQFCLEQRWKKNKSSYVPSKTLVVDLKKGKERLWKDLSKDARQTIKKRNGVKISKVAGTKQNQEFWKRWKKSGKGYVPGLKEFRGLTGSFGKKSWLIGARVDGQMVAGVVILVSENTAYYYFAWTDKKGRELGAQYKLVWEAMMMAKKEKLKWWDFEGIEDERNPRKSWEGFSRFKKKFGGEEREYPGCFSKWF